MPFSRATAFSAAVPTKAAYASSIVSRASPALCREVEWHEVEDHVAAKTFSWMLAKVSPPLGGKHSSVSASVSSRGAVLPRKR